MEGSFFCIVPRAPPWYSSLSFKKRHSSADIEEQLEGVVERYSASLQDELASHHASLGHPPHTSVPHEAHKFVYPSGGLVWRPGLSPVTGNLVHVTPYVQQDAARSRVVVFFGYLSNLNALQVYINGADVSASAHGDQRGSARSSYETVLGATLGSDPLPHSQPRSQGSSGRRLWTQSSSAGAQPKPGGVQQPAQGPWERAGLLTTSTLLKLYDLLGSGQEMLLLSELQGEYAFVIFDAAKKQAFAARDPTGEEALYMAVSAEPGGAAMFTNSLAELPPELERLGWQEVPPGHYVCGKQPTLHQFALTMEQLQARERQESCSLDDALLFGDGTPTTPIMHDLQDGQESAGGGGGGGSSSGLLHRLSRPWS